MSSDENESVQLGLRRYRFYPEFTEKKLAGRPAATPYNTEYARQTDLMMQFQFMDYYAYPQGKHVLP